MTRNTSVDAENQTTTETEKKEFKAPKLKFIEPKLTEHGDATKITGSFFGTFVPGDLK